MSAIHRTLRVFPAISFAITLFVASCAERPEGPRDKLDYFRQHLKSNMDDDDLEFFFGEADKVAGPAVSIYKYHLADSNEVWIGYTDRIVYACYVDKHHNLVEDILKP